MLRRIGLLFFTIVALMFVPQNSFSEDAATPAAPAAASAEDKDAKLADIRKLMNLTGGGDIGKQVVEQMLETFKQSNPNIPETFWTEFMKEVDANQLIELNVPIYDKHLTHEDIKGIIAFYESPVGKKFITVLPQIVEESYAAGQEWGYGIGTKLRNKLEKEGYLKQEEAVPAGGAAAPAAGTPAAPAAEPVAPTRETKPAQ